MSSSLRANVNAPQVASVLPLPLPVRPVPPSRPVPPLRPRPRDVARPWQAEAPPASAHQQPLATLLEAAMQLRAAGQFEAAADLLYYLLAFRRRSSGLWQALGQVLEALEQHQAAHWAKVAAADAVTLEVGT